MTLTELSYYFRKFMPFVILFSLVFLVFFYAFKLLFIYSDTKKVKPIYLNPIFGKIKKPIILEATNSAEYNFTLDTIEGQPLTATESAKVFYLPPSSSRFGYTEKIYLMAKTLGFDTEVVKHQLVNTDYIFNDEKESLKVNIGNFNFNYGYKLSTESGLFENTIIPDKNQILEKATEFFRNIGRYPEELSKGKTNIIYQNYNAQENRLYSMEKPVDANVVEIDYYRPDIDGFPVVTPKYYNSQNYVIMVFKDEEYKVIKAEINFFEKSDTQFGLYPIKTGDVAWNDLKTGRGMIVSSQENRDVVIKKMFMAYLDPNVYQDYLQPVYVFLGENNFVGYVPAVEDSYVE